MRRHYYPIKRGLETDLAKLINVMNGITLYPNHEIKCVSDTISFYDMIIPFYVARMKNGTPGLNIITSLTNSLGFDILVVNHNTIASMKDSRRMFYILCMKEGFDVKKLYEYLKKMLLRYDKALYANIIEKLEQEIKNGS